MTNRRLLSCLKKRDLLNSVKADRAELVTLGERYLREERISDCIDFFAKAEHLEGLALLKERCLAEGDYFLFNRLAKILAEGPSSDELVRLGDNALDREKLLFARSAYHQAGQPEKAAKVEELLNSLSENRISSTALLH